MLRMLWPYIITGYRNLNGQSNIAAVIMVLGRHLKKKLWFTWIQDSGFSTRAGIRDASGDATPVNVYSSVPLPRALL